MSTFQQDEYKRGELIYLDLISEIVKVDYHGNDYVLRTLKDSLGRLHTETSKPSINHIDKSNFGEKIQYVVTGFWDDFSPKLSEIDINREFFIELDLFSKPVIEMFNEISNYQMEVDGLDLKKQYESKNGNWVWTLLKFLKSIQTDKVKNLDYEGAVNFLLIIKEVYETLKKSKFLLTYSEDRRKELKKGIDNGIMDASGELYLIENIFKIDSSKKAEKILEIFNDWIKSDEDPYKFDTIQPRFIIKKFEEMLSNELIEEIAIKLSDDKSNNLHFKRFVLNRWLRVRKKRIRNIVFKQEVDNNNPNQSFSLKDNKNLKHLIFLTNFDFKNHSLKPENETHLVLIKSSLLRFQAYYEDDTEKAKKCIEFLLSNIGKDSTLDEKERREWLNDFNFEMAHNYRFLAKKSTDIDTTIKLYTSSSLYYQKLRSTQTEVDKGFIKYFEMAKLIEIKAPFDLIKKESLKQYEYLNQPDARELLEDYPFLNELKELFSILTLIGSANDSESSFYRLFDIALRKFDKEDKKPDTLYLSSIAGLILASNLLDDEKQELLQDQLSKVFMKGVIEVQKLPDIHVDTDSKEYKEIQLFNLLSNNESQTLEYKGSWDLDIDVFILPKKERLQYKDNDFWGQSFEVSRAVASMLNANRGGKLFIGVLEIKKKYKQSKNGLLDDIIAKFDGEILDGEDNLLIGIEKELKRKGWDSDQLIQNINNQLKEDIDTSVIQNCLINSKRIKQKEIIEISILDNSFSKHGWWINNNNDLPVRENNQIVTKRGREAREWLDSQAKKFKKITN